MPEKLQTLAISSYVRRNQLKQNDRTSAQLKFFAGVFQKFSGNTLRGEVKRLDGLPKTNSVEEPLIALRTDYIGHEIIGTQREGSSVIPLWRGKVSVRFNEKGEETHRYHHIDIWSNEAEGIGISMSAITYMEELSPKVQRRRIVDIQFSHGKKDRMLQFSPWKIVIEEDFGQHKFVLGVGKKIQGDSGPLWESTDITSIDDKDTAVAIYDGIVNLAIAMTSAYARR